MRASRTFDGVSGSIAGARRLVTAFLRRVAEDGRVLVPDLVADSARLVVSELVTNAVRHTEGPFAVDLTLVGRTVEISVRDSSARPVLGTSPDPARVGRHGMEIVTAICGGYDVVPTAAGKRITVRIRL